MGIVLYARVSTDEQANSGCSLDAQIARLRAYAELYGLPVVEEVVDAGESAKSLNRPGMQQALTMLWNGEADGVAVCKLDRLTRSVGDWQHLVADYFNEKSGYALHSIEDRLDSSTAMGRLIINVTLSVSQWERETTGERTKAALQHKIAKGERCGKVRFGYNVGTDGKSLVPVEQEQQAICLMRQLRSQGLTYRAIAAELSNRSIAPKEATLWSHAAVRQILNRKVA